MALPRTSFPWAWRPTAHQEPKKELRTQKERTRHTQEPRTKNETPRTCPENSPAHPAPHTLTGARNLGRGCLSRGHDRTVPRDGSGEPARAWSPAWDTIAGGSLQWLPARVMSVLPRWHTQRCGRCQNSRYLYGQTRALPLSSSTCSARTSPSTILRHRPPVTRS